MTFDAEALTFAADLATDRVLLDPSDDAILLAVEEYMQTGSRRFSDRLSRGVLMVYADVESGADATTAVRRAQSVWGLC